MIRSSLWLLNLFLIFGFFGCATTAQNQAALISQNQRLVIEKSTACYESVVSKPNHQEILNLIGKNLFNFTLEQLSDEGLASDQEVASIVSFHNDLVICRQQLIIDQMAVNPGAIPIFTQSWQESDSVMADLINRKITFGEANKRQSAIAASRQAKLIAQFDQLMRDLAASHYAEAQQRQSAFFALAHWSQQQQMLMQNQQLINAVNRPVMTNCNRVGNSVQCTSY